ncbi:hypothetical protein CHARACLAT_002337 [Characodon lateralis]|uniref:TNFR-Cys domain-containing protein n=1 Tax=Characodon lateralis TaxID=208331 RepID=A0ABU7E6F3_9TELE|nr:hypothetical protein [Characodon lateralis]
MHKLQVSVVSALLMMFDPTSPQLLRPKCPSCPTGYYVTRNCSFREGTGFGTKCAQCTDCSAFFQETVVPCSAYTNSVCSTRTTPMPKPVQMTASPSSMWIGLLAASLSLFVVLLLIFFFTWMSCRNKGTFMKLLPLQTSSPEKKDPPPSQSHLLVDVPV